MVFEDTASRVRVTRIYACVPGAPAIETWSTYQALTSAGVPLSDVGVWELAAEFDRKGGALPRMIHAHNRVRDGAAPLIGRSPAMCHLRERIERVAATDFTVLIEGESGSGKELVARQIHDVSARRRNAFVALNCAAIVDTLLEAELLGIEDRAATGVRGRRGKFELAHHGTLFLDEVADLSPAAQAKLLRVLQDFTVERVGGHKSCHVDTRIVAATNRK